MEYAVFGAKIQIGSVKNENSSETFFADFQPLCQLLGKKKATNVGYQVKVGKSTINDHKNVRMQNTTTLEGKHLSCKTKTEKQEGKNLRRFIK